MIIIQDHSYSLGNGSITSLALIASDCKPSMTGMTYNVIMMIMRSLWEKIREEETVPIPVKEKENLKSEPRDYF